MTHTQREREGDSLSDFDKSGKRDFPLKFNQPRSKSKLWLGIILGALALAGAGTTIYLVTRPKTETKTLTTEERVQQFQNQLAQKLNRLIKI